MTALKLNISRKDYSFNLLSMNYFSSTELKFLLKNFSFLNLQEILSETIHKYF